MELISNNNPPILNASNAICTPDQEPNKIFTTGLIGTALACTLIALAYIYRENSYAKRAQDFFLQEKEFAQKREAYMSVAKNVLREDEIKTLSIERSLHNRPKVITTHMMLQYPDHSTKYEVYNATIYMPNVNVKYLKCSFLHECGHVRYRFNFPDSFAKPVTRAEEDFADDFALQYSTPTDKRLLIKYFSQANATVQRDVDLYFGGINNKNYKDYLKRTFADLVPPDPHSTFPDRIAKIKKALDDEGEPHEVDNEKELYQQFEKSVIPCYDPTLPNPLKVKIASCVLRFMYLTNIQNRTLALKTLNTFIS